MTNLGFGFRLDSGDEDELGLEGAQFDDHDFSQRGSVLRSPTDFDGGLGLAGKLEVAVVEVETLLVFGNLLEVDLWEKNENDQLHLTNDFLATAHEASGFLSFKLKLTLKLPGCMAMQFYQTTSAMLEKLHKRNPNFTSATQQTSLNQQYATTMCEIYRGG